MRKTLLALALACSVPVLLSGCATSASVASAPISAGRTQSFDAPYDAVKRAAVDAVRGLRLDVQNTDETPERFQIQFTKSVSAFSWGEVGVVNVVRGDNASTTVVYVHTQKRDQLQVTGTSERQFAEQIFARITASLAAAPQ